MKKFRLAWSISTAVSFSITLFASSCSSSSGSGGVYGQLTTNELTSSRIALPANARTALLTSPSCTDGTSPDKFRCSVSPANYTLAYTKMELVKLATGSSADANASIGDVDINTATTISDSSLETTPEEFAVPENAPAEFSGISMDGVSGDYDGVAITYAYLKQELDAGILGQDGTIDDWNTYEICLNTGNCSNAEASIGDYLLQGASVGWGFIHYTECEFTGDASCAGYSIESTLPENFSATDPAFTAGSVTGEGWHLIKGTGPLTAYRVFYAFEADATTGSITHTLDADSEITLTYSVKDSFEWHDGAMMEATEVGSGSTSQPSKVGGRTSSTADSLSAGTFNPIHDNAFLPRMPGVKVEVSTAATADSSTGT